MAYKPTEWENTVYDDEGNILRKGTPIMAENLNKIENKLVSLDGDSHTHKNKEIIDKITQTTLDKVHSHENKTILNQITQKLIDDSHNHENKAVLDKIAQNHLDTIGEHSKKLTDHEQKIANLVQGLSNLKIQVVQNITERDLLENKSSIVHVIDASDDPTVESGWAQYIYQGNKWIKIAEKESLDVVLKWADIIGKPTTFKPESHSHEISDITNLAKEKEKWDSAYKAKHNHENKNVLDLITQTLVDDSHDHTNKLILDKISQDHLDNLSLALSRIKNLEDGSTQLHTHKNKATIDKLTQKHLDNSHSHSNKTVLDNITESMVNRSHSHDNKAVLDKITQALLDKIHTHKNKATLDKITYSGSKTSIELSRLDELEKHTHSYNDLTDKPFIPKKISHLEDDSEFVKSNAGRITVSSTAPSNPKENDVWIVI